MYYRVFGTNGSPVEPLAFLKHLNDLGLEVATSFKGDAHGWFQADMLLPGEDEPIRLERFLADEDDIRREIHTWIAWLEQAGGPQRERLMDHLVAARQVFTLLVPPDTEAAATNLALAVCRYLALETGGTYQVDGRGIFAADGELLVAESG